MNEKSLLGLGIGRMPRVVGTVSSYTTLKGVWVPEQSPCDMVEVRLDDVGTANADWLNRCTDIESLGIPVILTLRSQTEGGKWNGSEQERENVLAGALDVLATIDVEWSSEIKKELCQQSEALSKPIIVSHHNFSVTPELSFLQDVVDGIVAMGNTIPKISTLVHGPKDVEILQELLGIYSNRLPICIIGMGAKGTKTRLRFPLSGSALTYGYLDRSSAPGQLSAQVLFENLRIFDSEYNAEVIDRKEILEFA